MIKVKIYIAKTERNFFTWEELLHNRKITGGPSTDVDLAERTAQFILTHKLNVGEYRIINDTKWGRSYQWAKPLSAQQ